MSDRSFLDTNVLVYAYDKHERKKQARAQSILKAAIQEESGCLSAQVLGEFFTVVTRKIEEPLTSREADAVIQLLSILPVQEIDRVLVQQAIHTHERYGISYWDSLIVAAAVASGCVQVHSEDLKDGETYNGVRVVNPFKD